MGIEHWSCPRPPIPATRITGVVKVRVTSSKRALRPRCGRRGCGLEARLLRKEQKLKLQTRTARSHRVSRDGAVQSYFVWNTMRGASKPRYSVRFSSRRDFEKRHVVKDRVASLLEREAVGSIPTWSKHTCRC